MSKDNKPSAEALAGYIADALRTDPEAEKAFRASPEKFLEEQSGKTLPKGVKVEVHENSDTVWHIPLGARSGPIDEVQLGGVSGGDGHPATKLERAGWEIDDWMREQRSKPRPYSARKPK